MASVHEYDDVLYLYCSYPHHAAVLANSETMMVENDS